MTEQKIDVASTKNIKDGNELPHHKVSDMAGDMYLAPPMK